MTSLREFSRKHVFAPNGLSALRGLVGMIIPFLVMSPEPRHHALAGFIFTLAAFSDMFDGMLARMMNMVTDFGKFVDPLADKVLVLGTFLAFVLKGYYSVWWIVPIFAREILVTFFRYGWVLEGKVIGAERLGKIKLTVQVAAIAFSFFFLFSESFESWAGAGPVLEQAMHGLIITSAVLTVLSGITFLWNQRKLMRSPFFARYVSAMGVGLLPAAPGTWGSLAALGFVLLTAWNPWLYAVTGLVFTAAGYWAMPRMGSAGKDPGFIVLDEAAGIFVTFAFIPVTPLSLLAGFVFFRLFDIFKPWPCRRLEKIPGFTGVLADDLMAGVYAAAALGVMSYSAGLFT